MGNMTERALAAVQKKVKVAKANAQYATSVFLKDDRGDTNFLSILILLGIALALAGVFLTFRETIVNWVNRQMGNFSTNAQNANTVSDTGIATTSTNAGGGVTG